jgi:hypothetical protein
MDKYRQLDLDWLACMERIGRKETACFENDSVGYTDQIVGLNCRRGIMVWVYSTMKTAKRIKPIEDLELEDKKKMWAFINEICEGKDVDKQRKIEVIKVFYVIEYFINENK